MKGARVDRVSLVAGAAVLALAGLLALDQGGEVDVSSGVMAAVVVGIAGLIVLVSGLFERR
jgi:ABC-type uncharacterized transport system permease subunit